MKNVKYKCSACGKEGATYNFVHECNGGMSAEEVRRTLKTIDQEMDAIRDWIKYYYSDYETDNRTVLDIKTMELSYRLERYSQLYLKRAQVKGIL